MGRRLYPRSGLDHCVAHTIRAYPLLFRGPDYASSRLLVLHHLFLVLGNGYEWEKGELKSIGDDRRVSDDLQFEPDFFTKPMIKKVSPTFEMDERSEPLGDRGILYPICDLTPIVEMPDDVKDDWLAGAREITDFAVSYWSRPPSKWRLRKSPSKHYTDGERERYRAERPEQLKRLVAVSERIDLLQASR